LLNGKQPVFYAFDLLWINGEDIRQSPLIERKQRLSGLVRGCECIIYAQHIDGGGKQLFHEICSREYRSFWQFQRLFVQLGILSYGLRYA
jgi:ATP-dependent DNA ligase